MFSKREKILISILAISIIINIVSSGLIKINKVDSGIYINIKNPLYSEKATNIK